MTTGFQPLPNISPIAYVSSLAYFLGVDCLELQDVAENIDDHWLPGKSEIKSDGSIRQTHSGTKKLKQIQKRINNKILSKVYYPTYLNGGLKNDLDGTHRNHITNAKLHRKKRIVVSADIAGFFPNTNRIAIRSIWQGFFPFAPEVANLLTRLTCYKDELPQGWVCSSYLSQLVFWDTEYQLFVSCEQKGISYSRYIDDFTLSTNKTFTEKELTNLFRNLAKLCMQKGLRLKGKKSKVESRSRCQTVNKIVVNKGKISLLPKYRKELRARIHNFSLNSSQLNPIQFTSELKSIKGQITYLGKFHPNQAEQLGNKLQKFTV